MSKILCCTAVNIFDNPDNIDLNQLNIATHIKAIVGMEATIWLLWELLLMGLLEYTDHAGRKEMI